MIVLGRMEHLHANIPFFLRHDLPISSALHTSCMESTEYLRHIYTIQLIVLGISWGGLAFTSSHFKMKTAIKIVVLVVIIMITMGETKDDLEDIVKEMKMEMNES